MRIRIFLAFTLVILITLFVMGFWYQKNTLEQITTFADRGGFFGVDRIAENLESYYENHQSWNKIKEYIRTEMPAFNASKPGRFMPGAMGGNQSQGNPEMQGNQNNSEFALADADGEILYGRNLVNSSVLDAELLSYTIPLYSGDEIIGYIIPPGSYLPDKEYINSLSNNISGASYVTIAVSGTIALILALALGYLLTKPVKELETAALKMAEGDFSQRVNIKNSPELRSLGESFNHMAESIQKAKESRTALTADISHELRTPLAVQRANLEAIQDGIYPLTQENLSIILEQNNMLSHLVDDLHTIAKTDDNEFTLILEEMDIPKLIKSSIDAFHAQTEKKNIRIEFNTKDKIPLIKIDIFRFQQVLNNLIKNAIRHTPAGGKIEIITKKTDNALVINVSDNGSGIPVESLPRIFDRFYRADDSRSREKGGAGLGLTIAKRFVEAHNGSLTANNNPGGGAIFTITLPID